MIEKGFILPSGLYIQAIDTAEKRDDEGEIIRPEITAANYPEGTVEVPLRPGPDYQWQGGAWVYVEPPYQPATLSPARFEYMLAITGLGDVWAVLERDLKTADLAAYAMIRAQRAKSQFELAATLAMVEQFRAQAEAIAPDADLSDAAITKAWDAAAAAQV